MGALNDANRYYTWQQADPGDKFSLYKSYLIEQSSDYKSSNSAVSLPIGWFVSKTITDVEIVITGVTTASITAIFMTLAGVMIPTNAGLGSTTTAVHLSDMYKSEKIWYDFSKKRNENIWPEQYGPPPTTTNTDWNKSDEQLATERANAANDSRRGPATPHNFAKKTYRNKRTK